MLIFFIIKKLNDKNINFEMYAPTTFSEPNGPVNLLFKLGYPKISLLKKY